MSIDCGFGSLTVTSEALQMAIAKLDATGRGDRIDLERITCSKDQGIWNLCDIAPQVCDCLWITRLHSNTRDEEKYSLVDCTLFNIGGVRG